MLSGRCPGDTITVTIPAYKAAHTIRAAVKSCLYQLNESDRIVVSVTDSSWDHTMEILGKIEDSRLSFFDLPRGTSIADARNKILGCSESRWVAALDADDIALPGRFDSQLRFIRKYDLDFAFGGVVFFGDTKVRIQRPLQILPDESRYLLASGNPFPHSTMLAKREAVVSLGGYSGTFAEDYSLWMRAALSGYRLGRSPKYLSAYRVHEAQASQTPAMRAYLDANLKNMKSEYRQNFARKFQLDPLEELIEVLKRKKHLLE